jgi:hypothetical protein
VTRSLRWRLMFAPRRYSVPTVSPYAARLQRAAYGGHVCRVWIIPAP